jgi:hypothetical protein
MQILFEKLKNYISVFRQRLEKRGREDPHDSRRDAKTPSGGNSNRQSSSSSESAFPPQRSSSSSAGRDNNAKYTRRI